MLNQDGTSESALLNERLQILEVRGAGATLVGIRTRLAHLEGTFRILEGLEASEDTCLAGLFHSAYDKTKNGQALFSPIERSALAKLIGARAERIVWAYHLTDWYIFDGSPSIRGEISSLQLDLAADELAALFLVRAANIAECSSASDGSPIPWIHKFFRIMKLSGFTMPELLIRASHETYDLEQKLIGAYDAAWSSGLNDSSIENLRNTADSIAIVAEPFILLALHACCSRNLSNASNYAKRARTLMLQWNTSWDKRILPESWLALIALIEQVSAAQVQSVDSICSLLKEIVVCDTALVPERLLERLTSAKLFPQFSEERNPPTDFEDEFNSMPSRFVEYLDGLRAKNPMIALSMYPGLTSKPYWDSSLFPLARELELNAEAIIEEFNGLEPDQFHEEIEAIKREGSWKVFMLYERGRKREDQCKAVPITAQIMERQEATKTNAGLIYFSRLAPKTIVEPHRGPTNLRLRCHLGIKIPPGCIISVDNVEQEWKQGRCVIFDDSYMHMVWNSSEVERVVLIVDLWHPELSEEEIELLTGLHEYSVSVTRSLSRYWEKNEQAAFSGSVAGQKLVTA